MVASAWRGLPGGGETIIDRAQETYPVMGILEHPGLSGIQITAGASGLTVAEVQGPDNAADFAGLTLAAGQDLPIAGKPITLLRLSAGSGVVYNADKRTYVASTVELPATPPPAVTPEPAITSQPQLVTAVSDELTKTPVNSGKYSALESFDQLLTRVGNRDLSEYQGILTGYFDKLKSGETTTEFSTYLSEYTYPAATAATLVAPTDGYVFEQYLNLPAHIINGSTFDGDEPTYIPVTVVNNSTRSVNVSPYDETAYIAFLTPEVNIPPNRQITLLFEFYLDWADSLIASDPEEGNTDFNIRFSDTESILYVKE